jgi:branched-chain amino acid transport system substrate-binding protein
MVLGLDGRMGAGWRAGLLVVAVAVIGAGCSSTAKKPATTASTAGGAASVSTVAPPTGAPIVIGVLYAADNPAGNTPEINGAAQAAADYVNKELGGIGGRPIQIDSCNGKNAPESDVQCATKWVNDGAIDVIGLDGLWGPNGVGVLEKAGVVNQTSPVSGPELTSPIAYPFGAFTLSGAGALAKVFVKKGIKAASCVYVDIAVAKSGCFQSFGGPIKAAGITNFITTAIPPTATDVSQYVQAAVKNNPDIIYMVQSPPANARFVQAASQLGVKATLAAPSSSANVEQFFKPVGAAANGIVFHFDWRVWTDTSDPDVRVFNDVMKRYGPGVTISGNAVLGFSAIMTLKRLGDKIGGAQMTRVGLLAALQHLDNLNEFMGPTLTSSHTVPGFPHVVKTGNYIYQYNNGTFTDIGGGYVDTFSS